MFILNASDIYNMELTAKNSFRLTDEILMENAGIHVYKKIKKKFNKDSKIAVLAGPGNNGGDGFVTARHLISSGYNVDIFYTYDDNMYKDAAKTNLNILKAMGANLYSFSDVTDFTSYNIIVDALFGIGLKRSIKGIYENIINLANISGAYIISVDIPSGLYADSGFVENTAIKADCTITFSCLKYCLSLYPAKKYAGKIKVKNITIPKKHIEKYSNSILINKHNLPTFNKREIDSNKGTFGRVAVIGGSYEMAGAVKITAYSAFKSGCGLVTILHPNELNRNFISDIPELMSKTYDYNNPALVYEYVNQYASSCTLGNGMGINSNIKEFISSLIKNVNKPVILDADGLNNLSLDDLLHIENTVILTPHLKEFSRLINENVENIVKNKIEIVKEFVNKYKVVLILKSADTIIAMPQGRIYILNGGNTALSKGGSGDALCGLTASFLAQKYSVENACILAVYTLSKAAEYAVIKNHPASILITDIINKYYKKVFNG